jgi:hypothetical protein
MQLVQPDSGLLIWIFAGGVFILAAVFLAGFFIGRATKK